MDNTKHSDYYLCSYYNSHDKLRKKKEGLHLRKRNYLIVLGVLTIVISSIFIGVFVPQRNREYGSFSGGSLIENTASTFKISDVFTTKFASYNPINIDFSAEIPYTEIAPNLANVDLQGIDVTTDEKRNLEKYGFVFREAAKHGIIYSDEFVVKDLLDVYTLDGDTYFVTTDVCLHLFHLMYEFSLKVIELENFFDVMYLMFDKIRTDQIDLYNSTSDMKIQNSLERNIAYLSVMLYFLDENSTAIPSIGQSLTQTEINNIVNQTQNESAIFQYEELFQLYKVRGHYNDHENLAKYFKAMLYTSRMSFLLQESSEFPGLSTEHTRMMLLLLSSFNLTTLEGTIWELWEKIYIPTTFYVGESDDLTPLECFEIWKEIGSPIASLLGNDTIIEEFKSAAANYRKPLINSMFLKNMTDYENKTLSFRFFGQRFVPDNYIFQQLMHPNVEYRMLPNGLDVFSVFGSPRADYHLQEENESYVEYGPQIEKLRDEFGELNATHWTQNLYWMWLYTLFPLLEPAKPGYPSFMQNDAWSDKALMTTMGSWAELKHDTTLYTKYPWQTGGWSTRQHSYVEPYPEVYSRLSSLTQYLIDGLENYNLCIPGFIERLELLKSVYDRLTDISVRILKNKRMSDADSHFLYHFGYEIYWIYEFEFQTLKVEKERSALIADVAGFSDLTGSYVLEVAVGDPYIILVIIPDHRGKLYLTYGATYSYYEFIQSADSILNDEEWQDMLDNNPPALPEWITQNLPIIVTSPSALVMTFNQRRKEEYFL
ncbi:MAG: DUF3160 domain-containing protein [Asgard group archaeon]|nr:DUF3160 domain-containing protein [Asgard group archaeon]